MAGRRPTDITLLLCSKCFRVLRHEFRADLGAASTPGEDRGSSLLSVYGGHIRELGLARTGHQRRAWLERWAVRDRSPRLGRGRRYRSPARRSRGTPHREPSGLDRLVARVLGYAVRPGGRSQPSRAGRESFLVRRPQQRCGRGDERPGGGSPAADGTSCALRHARDAQPRGCPRCRSGRPCCAPWRYTAATLPRLCGGCRGGGPRRVVPALDLTGRCKGGTVGRRSSEHEWLEAVVWRLVGFRSPSGGVSLLLHTGRGRGTELV